MNKDFHYYATYCAAIIAGYTHEEALDICYSAQLVDLCTVSFLKSINGPEAAATTQLQLELADARTDIIGLQEMTRIWASFHFLPRDLYRARGGHCGKTYMDKYRLIAGPNGELVKDTVNLAKGSTLQAAGIAMHVLADTWAHRYFAGTPSLVINSTNAYFYEIVEEGGKVAEYPVHFIHNPSRPDDLDKHTYTNSIGVNSENSIMNLGHGRAGHLPDYSFIRYRYMPAWGDYKEIVKDNPHDYMCAFTQMIYALKFLRGVYDDFEVKQYDKDAIAPYKTTIESILTRRQLDSSADWKAFGEKLSGKEIVGFDLDKYKDEFTSAKDEDARYETFLGEFFVSAMAQKSMITAKIFRSSNLLAGYSIAYSGDASIGVKDYMALLRHRNPKDLIGAAIGEDDGYGDD